MKGLLKRAFCRVATAITHPTFRVKWYVDEQGRIAVIEQ